jgi:hypothetical protein
MRKSMKVAVIAVGVVVAGATYFAENIRGYYRFKELCETEGGLRVLHPLQKGVGWRVSSHGGGLEAASFRDVAFVRMPNAQGQLMDFRYRGGRSWDERSYEATPIDEAKPVIYEIKWTDERLPGERRTSRSGWEMREIATGRLMARWYQIGYSTFDQDRTLLAAPSGQACHRWNAFFTAENQAKYFAD